MFLAARFFSYNDIFLVPLCLLILFFIVRQRAEKPENKNIRSIYYSGFIFKIFFVFAYTIVTEYVFKGGDTGLYYQTVLDLRAALADDFGYISVIARTSEIDAENPIAPYIYYDNYADDFTFNYMRNVSNFFVPRLGLLPALVFMNSYLCISLIFGFFALAGSIRIFKFFYYYYPLYKKEISIASIFIPSVTFWSSGFLKDPVTFASIGFILYATLSIFVKKENIKGSVGWILISGYLLFNIKVYILLAFILALVIWLFAETNKVIKDSTLRKVFSVFTFASAIIIAYFLLDYFTTQDAAQSFKLETLLERTEKQRTAIESVKVEGNSAFKINSSNPVLLVFESLIATFFRPFVWEINTPIAFFSAIESLFFLLLTLNFFFKRGVSIYFKTTFADPKLLMCFVFAVVFAVAVGASTTNFGALSRYKIPCMPFYFIMLLLVYKKAGLEYPSWFSSILNRIK
jgi:hypothetical protein